MANISDLIEQFILANIGEESDIEISRRELANHFEVAPSQINYVLSTRFTVERGFVVEGHRGGGGYIRLVRLRDDGLNRILSESIGNQLTYSQAVHLIERLVRNGHMSEDGARTAIVAVSPKALATPFNVEDSLRANIMKQLLIDMMKN